MSIAIVEYLTDIMPEPLINRNGSINQVDLKKLSYLSRAVIDSVIEKDIVIVLSQGPLNVTPIITSLYVEESHQDVVVGLPKANFYDTYKRYTKEFFSLQYRAIKESITTSSMLFYRDIAWCKGAVSNENELEKLEIEVNPVYGNNRYKKMYREWMDKKINDESIYQNPKIVYIPIESSIPTGILNELETDFQSYIKYVNLQPGLIILESINERRFNFTDLASLISTAKEQNKKLLLHFSWPYLKGLEDFLSRDEIKNHSSIAIYHFGKQYCIKNQPIDNLKPPSKLLPLSLEGELWDGVYYPKKDKSSRLRILLPQLKSQLEKADLEKITMFDYYTDRHIKIIRSLLNNEHMSNDFNRFLMLFPTVIDTFMFSSEMVIETNLGNGNWRYLSIENRLKNLEKGLKSVGEFSNLCNDLDRCKDISYYINGLHTYSAIGKRTLLQTYIIECLNELLIAIENRDSNQLLSQRIIIAHLHPYLKGTSRINTINEHLTNSINNVINNMSMPKIFRDNEIVILKFNEQKHIIFDGNKLISPILTKLGKNSHHPIKCILKQTEKGLEIRITIDINIDYNEVFNNELNERNAQGIDIYYAIIQPNGCFKEITLSKAEFYSRGNYSIITAFIKNYFASSTTSSIIEQRVELRSDILDIGVISKLPREQVVESRLLIPGPLPFGTVHEHEIVITQGHDALLQPFKEIAIFAYPGNNFSAILRQINIVNELVSTEENDLSNADLNFSIHNMKNTNLVEIPEVTNTQDIDDKTSDENIIDVIFRKDMMTNTIPYENDEKLITELSDIWRKIPKGGIKMEVTPYHQREYYQKGTINFQVRFDDNHIEEISFTRGTLIRKKVNDEYIITPVEDIDVDDIIFYMDTAEYDSIDNYLLKEYAEDQDMSLEQILEPFTCLKIFYETINAIDSDISYTNDKMKNLYWLTEPQRESLYQLIATALVCIEDINNIRNLLEDNSIWATYLDAEKIRKIFTEGRDGMTYNKLYDIVKNMGMTLQKDSFRSVCSSSINNQKHYYFEEDANMLAIGRILGHQGIISDYKHINDRGKSIRVVLQIIGLSISRVAAGKGDPFNEMDKRVEKGMIKCTIMDKIIM